MPGRPILRPWSRARSHPSVSRSCNAGSTAESCSALYQPIVELPDGEVRYVEALAAVGALRTGCDHAGRVPGRRGRHDGARAHRAGRSLIEAAQRGADWRRAFPDRSITVSVNLVRRPLRAPRARHPRRSTSSTSTRFPVRRSSPSRSASTLLTPSLRRARRSTAPGAQPRRRDHRRRLRCDGGRRRTSTRRRCGTRRSSGSSRSRASRSTW